MILGSGAERYAQALLVLSIHDKKVEEREEELKELIHLIEKKPDFSRYLHLSEIPLQAKRDLLNKIFADPLLTNFILLLIERGKLKFISQIAGDYHARSADWRGVIDATLITATEIDEEMRSKLNKRLSKSLKKKAIIHEQIDPSIIGGGIFIVGNQMIDFSVKGRLEKLKRALL